MISAALPLIVALSGQSVTAQSPPAGAPAQAGPAAQAASAASYVPERVFLSDKKRFAAA